MKNKNTYTQITKILAAFALFLLTIGLWATWAKPATAYEPSIYVEIPIIFWIGYALTAILLPILFYVLYRRGNLPKKFFLHLTAFLITLGSISLVFLYIIHGYDAVAYSGDVGTHLDNIYQLVHDNVCTSYYPGLYYLTGISILLCGVDYMLPILYLPAALTIFFLMGMYLVARRLTTVTQAHYITYFIAALFPFGAAGYMTGGLSFYYYLPYFSSLFLFPLGIYFIFRIFQTPLKRYVLGAFIVSSALVYYHPLGYLIYMIFVSMGCILCWIWVFCRKAEVASGRRMLSLLCCSFVSYVLWLFQTSAYKTPIGALRDILFRVTEETRFAGELNTVTDAVFGSGEYSILEIVELLFRQYALLIPLAVFIITVSLFVLCHILTRTTEKSSHHILEITTLLAFVTPVVAVAVSSLLVSLPFQPGRVIPYVSFCCIVLSGIAIYEIGKRYHSSSKSLRIFAGILIVGMIGCVCLMSPLSYYCSVHTVTINYQNTDTYLAYEVHYLSYKTPLTGGIGFDYPYRFVAYNEIYGNGMRISENLNLKNDMSYKTLELPDHFGYDVISTLGNRYTDELYLHIPGSVMANYESPHHPIWSKENHVSRYIRSDFTHLYWDPSVDTTYDVGAEKLYIIHPSGKTGEVI